MFLVASIVSRSARFYIEAALIHRYGLLMKELGRRPDDLRRLVSSSGAVFHALAAMLQLAP